MSYRQRAPEIGLLTLEQGYFGLYSILILLRSAGPLALPLCEPSPMSFYSEWIGVRC